MKAYAVKHEGQIDIRSVSPFPRGAAINWLFTKGVRFNNMATDDVIWNAFKTAETQHGATLVEVGLTEGGAIPCDRARHYMTGDEARTA